MAKKGHAVQFQAELGTDEEWEKFVAREGLLVIDVYSEWCGPCSSMVANLKKVKLELGSDILQFALANSNFITILSRFREKSEPTWLFAAGGKMVNLVFGPDAPRLNRIIAEELKKEQAVLAGQEERVSFEFTELIGEEKVRYEHEQEIIKQKQEKKEAKRAKQILEWRTAVVEAILQNYAENGIIIIFPQCVAEGTPAVKDHISQNGFVVFREGKVQLTEEALEEIKFFSENEQLFTEEEENLLLQQPIAALLLREVQEFEDTTDGAVLVTIYGESREPPGDPESLALSFYVPLPLPEEEKSGGDQGLDLDLDLGLDDIGGDAEKHEEEEEEGVEEEERSLGPPITGIWAPPNSYVRAMCIKHAFPKLYEPIEIPKPEPTPPHIAMIYEAARRRQVLEVIEKYPDDVLKFGFYTSDDPETAHLISKIPRNFDHYLATHATSRQERMVLEVSRKRSEAVLALAQLHPLKMSNNVEEGEDECNLFFPDDFDKDEEEVEEEEVQEEEERAGAAAPEADEGEEYEEGEEEEEGEEGEGQAEGAHVPEGGAAHAETAQAETAQGEAAQEAAQGQTEHGETAQAEAAHGETAQGEAAQGETAQ